METISMASSYHFSIFLLEELSAGQSARLAVQKYMKRADNAFVQRMYRWFVLQQNGRALDFYTKEERMYPYQKSLFYLLDRSFQGQSIIHPLEELIKEGEILSRMQLDDHIAKMPYKLMIPLLLLQFPALLLLLLGPIVLHLISEIS